MRSCPALFFPQEPSLLLASLAVMSHHTSSPGLASGAGSHENGELPTVHALPVSPKDPPGDAGSCEPRP